MAQQFIRVVNWEKFQHYKNRNPPWIKLYRETLTSRMWVACDDTTRVLAIACMLLAAETGNKIPLDADYFRRRAYLNGEMNLAPLVAAQFIEIFDETAAEIDASNVLAQRQRQRQSKRQRQKPHKSDASNLLASEQGNKPPAESEELVLTIAQTHPANWRSKGSMIIPPAHCDAIIRALQRDQGKVKDGTVAYAAAVEKWPEADRRFIINPVKFYNESHYLKDPELWERNTSGQPSKQADRTSRNRQTIINAFTENLDAAAGSGSSSHGKGTDKR